MELLLVRHAIAEERDGEKWPDDRGRPLTREGARKLQAVARILSRAWELPDLVLSSPLTRAWQTARILTEVGGWPEPQECPDLEPGRKPSEILATLKKQAAAEHIVLVGHEPSMHEILSFLLTGSAGGISLEVKKGGAALVHFDASIRAGAASLLWLLPPRLVLAAAKG